MTPQEPTFRQRLGAVLFADVVGYSRLMGRNEIDTYKALRALLERLEAACVEHGGMFVDVKGDGILARFDTATDAVLFGVELQRITERSNAAVPLAKKISFRVGIHLGEFLLDDRGIHGDIVNIAARLQEIADPGRVFVSSSVYEQVRDKLRLGYEFLGPQMLKNIEQPIPIFCIRTEVEGATMAATVRPSSPSMQFSRPDTPSIAVLPFDIRGGDDSESWFAEGLTEDIILALSKFKNLFVINRNTSFAFRTQDLPPSQAAAKLGVRYVVRGSVQRAKTKLRIKVELIDTDSSRTIWGETYKRDHEDIFEIQDEMTSSIVGAAAVLVEAEERRRFSASIPSDLAAYGFVLRAQQLIFKYTRQDNEHARMLYEQALSLDGKYARASAALSRTLNIDWRYSWNADGDEALDTALSYARRAADQDPTDARAFGELGFVHLYRKEHDAALGAYDRALKLNPNDADLLSDYADALAHSGQNEEAIQHLQRAMRLNPFFPDQYLWHLGGAYYNLKQYDAVIETVSKMNNPTEGQRMLAASYAQLGQTELARKIAEKHRTVHPNFSIKRWEQIIPDRLEEDTQHFLEGLKKAGF
ncbi:adenylate/guanylate cyclase domain-containing protein [Roseovarius atlanticus]|uniref:adenylate/guanylate cyclase domain-containing protein n=1 Tax=Roseovarius atlanticus TaxID=1641875 RepID=UPI0021BDB23C|nr:adenylate/guanylate cyclase domain-containing protein [Roseovarius atlanticus]